MNSYLDKFNEAIKNTVFFKLPQNTQAFIKEKSLLLKFSFSQIKQIVEIARDLDMWDESSFIEIFPSHEQKKVVIARLKKAYEAIRRSEERRVGKEC